MSLPPPDPAPDEALAGREDEFDDVDLDAIEREEWEASRRQSAISAGRRMGGAAGAAMAGAMLAIGEIYEGPPKDDGAVEIEASGEPGDIDADGIDVTVGEVDVWAPPPADSNQPHPD